MVGAGGERGVCRGWGGGGEVGQIEWGGVRGCEGGNGRGMAVGVSEGGSIGGRDGGGVGVGGTWMRAYAEVETRRSVSRLERPSGVSWVRWQRCGRSGSSQYSRP